MYWLIDCTSFAVAGLNRLISNPPILKCGCEWTDNLLVYIVTWCYGALWLAAVFCIVGLKGDLLFWDIVSFKSWIRHKLSTYIVTSITCSSFRSIFCHLSSHHLFHYHLVTVLNSDCFSIVCENTCRSVDILCVIGNWLIYWSLASMTGSGGHVAMKQPWYSYPTHHESSRYMFLLSFITS